MTRRSADAVPPRGEELSSEDGGMALGEHRFASLDAALETHQIPLDNRPVIRRFTSAVGIEAYIGTSSYLRAVRKDGGPDLHIAHGYTNGFRSRDEATAASGTPQVSASTRGWLVIHPINSLRDSGGAVGNTGLREHGTCSKCNTLKTPAGSCLCD